MLLPRSACRASAASINFRTDDSYPRHSNSEQQDVVADQT